MDLLTKKRGALDPLTMVRPAKNPKAETTCVIPFSEYGPSFDKTQALVADPLLALVGTLILAGTRVLAKRDYNLWFGATWCLICTLLDRPDIIKHVHTLEIDMADNCIDSGIFCQLLEWFEQKYQGAFTTIVLKNVTLLDAKKEDAIAVYSSLGETLSKLGERVVLDNVKGERGPRGPMDGLSDGLINKLAITVKNCSDPNIIRIGTSLTNKELHLVGCRHHTLDYLLRRGFTYQREYFGLWPETPANVSLEYVKVDEIHSCANKIAIALAEYLPKLSVHPKMKHFEWNLRCQTKFPSKISKDVTEAIRDAAEKLVHPDHGNNRVITHMSFHPIQLTSLTQYYLLENSREDGSFQTFCDTTENNNEAWLQKLIEHRNSHESISELLKAKPHAFFQSR